MSNVNLSVRVLNPKSNVNFPVPGLNREDQYGEDNSTARTLFSMSLINSGKLIQVAHYVWFSDQTRSDIVFAECEVTNHK